MCPVKIDLHDQILRWRRVLAADGHTSRGKRLAMKAAAALLARPAAYRAAIAAASATLPHLPTLSPGGRALPTPARETFRAWHARTGGRHALSTARDTILAAVRAAVPDTARPLPALPDWTVPDAERAARFAAALRAMGGTLLEHDPAAWIAERAAHGPVWSAVPEFAGTRTPRADTPPATLGDLEATVVRAHAAVAETGSVLFRECDLVVGAAAFLAQHLLVLLDPADIVGGLHDLYARPEFGRAPYLVLHSGPSATADIEGVLIRGAQGVRSLTVLLLARPG